MAMTISMKQHSYDYGYEADLHGYDCFYEAELHGYDYGYEADLHGYDRARDQFSVVPDRKVPGAYPHQVVEVKLHNQTTLRVHLKWEKF